MSGIFSLESYKSSFMVNKHRSYVTNWGRVLNYIVTQAFRDVFILHWSTHDVGFMLIWMMNTLLDEDEFTTQLRETSMFSLLPIDLIDLIVQINVWTTLGTDDICCKQVPLATIYWSKSFIVIQNINNKREHWTIRVWLYKPSSRFPTSQW